MCEPMSKYRTKTGHLGDFLMENIRGSIPIELHKPDVREKAKACMNPMRAYQNLTL